MFNSKNFKELVDYLITWKSYIVYFEEKPFEVNDVIAINLIVPSTYEGNYTPYEIISSHTYKVRNLEELNDLLRELDDYVEATIQFVLKDGRCRYMTICSNPQKWGIVELDNVLEDLEVYINGDSEEMK